MSNEIRWSRIPPCPPKKPDAPIARRIPGFRSGTPGKRAVASLAYAFTGLMISATIAAAVSPPSRLTPKSPAISARPATPTTTPVAQPTPTPEAKLTAAQKRQVRRILAGATDHYAAPLTQGQAALGTTQYSDPYAGVAAFDDPNSAASRFSSWRKTSGAEQDVQTYMNAFTAADAFYNAKNEPIDAITSWRDDISQVQADLIQWIQTAVGWQITEKTSADLQSSVSTFQKDLSKARADIEAVIAAS